MSIELASSRPLASAAEMKTLPAVNRPMARLSQTKRWRIKDERVDDDVSYFDF